MTGPRHGASPFGRRAESQLTDLKADVRFCTLEWPFLADSRYSSGGDANVTF